MSPRRGEVAGVVALLAVGVFLRAANLGGPAFCCDEFYDVLAAKSWLAGDGFQVPGRPYDRALLATVMTAGAFALFGESEAAARVPALVFGLLTMGLVYLAGRVLFDRTAGVVALALVALSPHAVDVSRFARLYSPLTFFVLASALAAYLALEGRDEGPRVAAGRVGWLAVAAAAALLAVHFHPVAGALGPVVLAYAGLRGAGLRLGGHRSAARPYLVVAALVAALALTALALPAVRERIAAAALTPLPWYQPSPGDAWIYHAHLSERYAWLWVLVWPATALVTLARPRAGLFVALAFWVPFLLVSTVVATKHPRYVVHLLPFAWLLLGGAAGLAWPIARDAIAARVPGRSARRGWETAAALAVVLIALVPPLRLTPSVVEAARRHRQEAGGFTTGRFQEWRELARRIGPDLPPDARIVATTWHAPIYYLGRPTNHLLPAFRTRGAGDWETPEREGSAQVQRAEDLVRLRAEGRPVWIVARRSAWEREGYLDPGLTGLARALCRPIALPPSTSFVVLDCGRPPPASSRDGRARPRGPIARRRAGWGRPEAGPPA